MIDIKRSQPPPELRALAEKGSRKWPKEVRYQLHEDFHGKCYLCEGPVTAGSLEVEHRKQLSAGGERYAWTNLYCSHGECNKRRPHWKAGGLLDPAGPEGVEKHLEQRPDYTSGTFKAVFGAIDESNQAAVNTAQELDHIHNAKGSIKASEIRKAISDHLIVIVGDTLRSYVQSPVDSPERAEFATLLRKLASRDSPYTMMVRDWLKTRHGDIASDIDID